VCSRGVAGDGVPVLPYVYQLRVDSLVSLVGAAHEVMFRESVLQPTQSYLCKINDLLKLQIVIYEPTSEARDSPATSVGVLHKNSRSLVTL
jgi:hypothetical protein